MLSAGEIRYFMGVHFSLYLQLSTNTLASSRREFGTSAVRQSVMLKKCLSRPMNVDWSHRGASMSNELKAIVVVSGSGHSLIHQRDPEENKEIIV